MELVQPALSIFGTTNNFARSLGIPPGLDAAVDVIVNGFRQRLGADVQVLVDLVDDIPAEKSGKFRYIISHA